MSFLVKEYAIPIMGNVHFIQASGYDEMNGKYYSKIQKSRIILANHCESLDELSDKSFVEIKKYFETNKISLEEEIVEKNKTVKTLGTLLSEANKDDWLKQKQTENPLQLELQKKQKIL